MDAVAAAEKMSRAGEKKQQRQSGSSFWGAMALKNRSQPKGGEAVESKNSSSKSKTTTTTPRSISIGRSITCAGSICGTKESAVLSRGSRRGSGSGQDRNSSSSRSLKAPDNDTLSMSMAATSAVVSASSSFNSETTVATTATTVSSSSSSSSPLSSIGAGSRSFRKLSGCYYECHSVVDPGASHVGDAAMAMLPCADCDEFFVKAESLELHRSTRHAVSELAADDTSRNVVEIIFQSSWFVRKPRATPLCRIQRILKVQNSGKTVERFEQYRERVKASAAASSADALARSSYPRCAADGNELLRFYCTTFNGCSLGLTGSTVLCRSPSQCKLCSTIRDGFRVDGDGKIATMATSGRAHDTARVPLLDGGSAEKRAMLVCRVVAGRVKKVVSGSNSSDEFGCDSVSSSSDLDEMFVFNSRAILPCFVVIYTVATES
ncbi:hypothetical protein ACQ4PT_056675 [Festuca glaucescens]